jgi:hypothetical protein
MNYFNPQSTSPGASTNNYTATEGDKLMVGGGLLDNTVSPTRFDAHVWGQETQELTITPTGNRGNYFAQQSRDASRVSWTPVYSLPVLNWLGTHNVKTGAYVAESTDDGEVTRWPFNILNASNHLLVRVTFTGGQAFRNWDMEYAFLGSITGA